MKIEVKYYETMFAGHTLKLRMGSGQVYVEPKITNKGATMQMLITAALQIKEAGGSCTVSEFKNYIDMFLTEQQKKQLIGELILKI